MSEQEKDDVPVERRRGYSEMKEELHHFFRRIWAVVIIIGLACTLGLVGYGFVLREIQQQRLHVCEDQNERHDATYQSLYDAAQQDIDNAEKLGVNADEIRRRRDVSLGLIDLLAPKEDCSEVVEQGFDAYMPW